MLENIEGAIKTNGQSRETGNIGYSRHRTNMVNVREYRWGKKNQTIQINWQHRVHKTQDTYGKCQRISKGNKKLTIQRNWQHRVYKSQDKYMLENIEGAIKMDNPEKLTIQGTQVTGQINVREYRRGNKNGQSRETGNIVYTRRKKTKPHYNMCWTPLYVNKHK